MGGLDPRLLQNVPHAGRPGDGMARLADPGGDPAQLTSGSSILCLTIVWFALCAMLLHCLWGSLSTRRGDVPGIRAPASILKAKRNCLHAIAMYVAAGFVVAAHALLRPWRRLA